MVNYTAEKYTILIALVIIILVFIIWFVLRTPNDTLSGFNISFDYEDPGYNGTVTHEQLDTANALGMNTFRWVETPQQMLSPNNNMLNLNWKQKPKTMPSRY